MSRAVLASLVTLVLLAGCGAEDEPARPASSTTTDPVAPAATTPAATPTPRAEAPVPEEGELAPPPKPPRPATPEARFAARVEAACRRAPVPADPPDPLTQAAARRGERRAVMLLAGLRGLKVPRGSQRAQFELVTSLRRLEGFYAAGASDPKRYTDAVTQTHEQVVAALERLGAQECRADSS